MTTVSCLFAYGTLMASAGGDALGVRQRLQLQREAHLIGSARLQGELYDLGRYPGLIENTMAGKPDALVRGEVWQLVDPTRSLQWLDRYEGIDEACPHEAEYRRVERSVMLEAADGERAVLAWVYIHVGGRAGARFIPGGFWPERPDAES